METLQLEDTTTKTKSSEGFTAEQKGKRNNASTWREGGGLGLA